MQVSPGDVALSFILGFSFFFCDHEEYETPSSVDADESKFSLL